MKGSGYEPHFAASVEAVASTGGQIMPPIMGAAAFLMADYLGIPYIMVVKAAVIPAFLYFFSAGPLLISMHVPKGFSDFQNLRSLHSGVL